MCIDGQGQRLEAWLDRSDFEPSNAIANNTRILKSLDTENGVAFHYQKGEFPRPISAVRSRGSAICYRNFPTLNATAVIYMRGRHSPKAPEVRFTKLYADFTQAIQVTQSPRWAIGSNLRHDISRMEEVAKWIDIRATGGFAAIADYDAAIHLKPDDAARAYYDRGKCRM